MTVNEVSEASKTSRHRLLFVLALMATVVTCCLWGCSTREPQSVDTAIDSSKLASPTNELPGLSNFAKVSDSLYRGAQPGREGFAQLKKMGVKTIVNLRTSSSDREALSGLGLDYVEIPVQPQHLDDEDVIAFLEIVRDPARHPIFVHCKHGADRTGTMVAMYRMVEQSWPRAEAIAELDRFGFHSIWINLKRYLERVDMVALKAKLEGQ